MIKINLVPKEILDKEAQRQRAIQIGVAAGLVLILIVGLSYWHYHTRSSLEAELAQAKADAERLKDAKSKLAQARSRQAAVQKRREVLQGLISSRRLYPVFMSDMVDMMPRSIWLENLKTKGTGPEALSVEFSAVALRPEDVADWLRVLNSSQSAKLHGRFSDAALTGGISIAETQDKFGFKMNYVLNK